MEDVEKLLRELDRAKRDRATWDSHWQEIAELVLTKLATFTGSQTPGSKRTRKQFDGTATWANEVFANGLHSMMTSMVARWFYMRSANYRLMRIYRVRQWFEEVTSIMYHMVFNSPSSNFHPQIHEVYLSMGALGTGLCFSEEKVGGGMQFRSKTLNESYIVENAAGMIDTLYREFSWPVHKVIEKWGEDAIPPDLLRKYKEGGECPDQMIVHVVKPNEKFNDAGVRVKSNMPFVGIYILLHNAEGKKGTILDTEGFHEFPYHVGRMSKRTGETYGEGPGMWALPDIKMLNEMKKTILKAAQKVVDPPLQLPDDGFLGPVITRPGGLNYYRTGSPDRIEAVKTEGRIDIGESLLLSVQQDVERAWYVDAFLTPDTKEGVNVKAAFVYNRRDERFRQLGPLLARAESGLLGTILIRTFNTLWRQGQFPDMPPELEGENLAIEYVSPIARAQRSVEGEDIQRLIALMGPVGEIDPSIWHNLDPDGLVDVAAQELYNIPSRVLRSPDDVATMRQQEKEAEQTNQVLGQAGAVSGALKDVATAQKNVAQARNT